MNARDATIEVRLAEITWLAVELEAERKRIGRVRDFWRRVIQEIRKIPPEREALHVSDITLRIGADLVHEAGEHVQIWTVDTVRGEAIDERMYRTRYFVGEGGSRFI